MIFCSIFHANIIRLAYQRLRRIGINDEMHLDRGVNTLPIMGRSFLFLIVLSTIIFFIQNVE